MYIICNYIKWNSLLRNMSAAIVKEKLERSLYSVNALLKQWIFSSRELVLNIAMIADMEPQTFQIMFRTFLDITPLKFSEMTNPRISQCPEIVYNGHI